MTCFIHENHVLEDPCNRENEIDTMNICSYVASVFHTTHLFRILLNDVMTARCVCAQLKPLFIPDHQKRDDK